MLESITKLTSYTPAVNVGTDPFFLDQWKSITFNRLVLNIVMGHHLHLRCHPLLFCNF